VNNAAVSLGGSLLTTTAETWQRTIDVNLTGTFRCAQAAARWMVAHGRPGRIVNVASTNSYAAERDACSYVASKGGVVALTRAIAKGVPLGRPAAPEEVVGAVAFLAGGDATFLTGAVLVVDGGYLAYARFN